MLETGKSISASSYIKMSLVTTFISIDETRISVRNREDISEI